MEKEESQRSKVDTWIRENEEAFIKAGLEPSVEVTKTGSFAVFYEKARSNLKGDPQSIGEGPKEQVNRLTSALFKDAP